LFQFLRPARKVRVFRQAKMFPLSNLFHDGLMRRKSPSGRDGNDSYPGPDHVYKRRRIRPIEDCVNDQENAADNVEELVGS
jgi:hypothetical protein